MGKGGATKEREGAGMIFGDEDDSDGDYGDDWSIQGWLPRKGLPKEWSNRYGAMM
jgi:hypothetical protein